MISMTTMKTDTTSSQAETKIDHTREETIREGIRMITDSKDRHQGTKCSKEETDPDKGLE